MNEREILRLEQQLLCEDVRGSVERISELLGDGFIEYCSSGKIYRYVRGDTLGHGMERNWEIVDFEAKELAIRELNIQLVNLQALEGAEGAEEAKQENLQSESEEPPSEEIEVYQCPVCESEIGSTAIRCPVCDVEFSNVEDVDFPPVEDDNETEVHKEEGRDGGE